MDLKAWLHKYKRLSLIAEGLFEQRDLMSLIYVYLSLKDIKNSPLQIVPSTLTRVNKLCFYIP